MTTSVIEYKVRTEVVVRVCVDVHETDFNSRKGDKIGERVDSVYIEHIRAMTYSREKEAIAAAKKLAKTFRSKQSKEIL